MIDIRQRDLLKAASGESIPPQAFEYGMIDDFIERGLITLERIDDDTIRPAITEAGRKVLAENAGLI